MIPIKDQFFCINKNTVFIYHALSGEKFNIINNSVSTLNNILEIASESLRESGIHNRNSETFNNSSEGLDVLSKPKEEKENKNVVKIVCVDKSADIFVVQTMSCFILKRISDFSVFKKIPFPKKLNTKKLLYDSHYVLKNNCLLMCMRGKNFFCLFFYSFLLNNFF